MIIKKCAAELIGSFVMVFLGTGAATVNELMSGSITQMGISSAFGLSVFIVILTLGKISGSHINPAVTFSLAVYRHFQWSHVLPYIISQCIGAILASSVLRFIYPASEFLGGTLPSGTESQSFLLEVFLGFLLMGTILLVIKYLSAHKITGAAIISTVVLLEAFFAGPICGASMNPARSLGPALVSEQVQHLWIYCTAPFIGMLLAGIILQSINKKTPPNE